MVCEICLIAPLNSCSGVLYALSNLVAITRLAGLLITGEFPDCLRPAGHDRMGRVQHHSGKE